MTASARRSACPASLFRAQDGNPTARYGDAFILVTDRLANPDRAQTCKGLVHELTHHFDYSFMFDTADLTGHADDSSSGFPQACSACGRTGGACFR